jgi:hypothetical protein
MLRFYFRNKSRQAFGPAACFLTCIDSILVDRRRPRLRTSISLPQRSKPPDHIEATCSILAVNSRYSLVN